MTPSIGRPLAALALILMVTTACGDDDGGEAATTSSPAGVTSTSEAVAMPAEEATPSLTLAVEGLTGSEGMAVVATLYTPDRYVGTVCIMVDDDPWTGSEVFTTSPDTNPCEKAPPYGEVITEAGDYQISIGLYAVGSSTPLACATATAVLSGPSEVVVPAANLGSDC